MNIVRRSLSFRDRNQFGRNAEYAVWDNSGKPQERAPAKNMAPK